MESADDHHRDIAPSARRKGLRTYPPPVRHSCALAFGTVQVPRFHACATARLCVFCASDTGFLRGGLCGPRRMSVPAWRGAAAEAALTASVPVASGGRLLCAPHLCRFPLGASDGDRADAKELAPGLSGGCVCVGCRAAVASVGCRHRRPARSGAFEADLGRARMPTGAAPRSVGLLLCRTAGGTAAGIGAATGLFRLYGGVWYSLGVPVSGLLLASDPYCFPRRC